MGQALAAQLGLSDRRADGPLRWSQQWSRRPRAAWLVSVAVSLGPLVLAVLVVLALDRVIVIGPGPWRGVAHFALLATVGFVVAETAARLLRSLAPLALLLKMSLAFPDVAPARYRVALRAGNPRLLEADPSWSALTPPDAASALIGLVARLSHHDRATRGHSERVRAYTELIAVELGLPETDRHQLRWTGLIHDVGKIRTPAHILNKPSALDEDEWVIIRRHPMHGLELAAPLQPWLGRHILGVSDHHERWAGGGYPSGVSGDDISQAGRIVAVADAFDVMTSSRSYKKPISIDAARQELVAQAGRQFDPEVVRAFLAISIRRVRLIVGPMAGLVALFGGRRIPVVPRVVRHAAGSAAVGAALALGVLGAGAVGDGSSDALRSDSTARSEPQVSAKSEPLEVPPDVLGDAVRRADGGTRVDQPVPARGTDAERPGASRDDADLGLADPGTDTDISPNVDGHRDTHVSDGDRDGIDEERGDRDHRDQADDGGGEEPRPTGERVALVIDPEAGSVTVEGMGPPEGVDIVEVPAAGRVTCDRIGICDPIVVETPIPAP